MLDDKLNTGAFSLSLSLSLYFTRSRVLIFCQANCFSSHSNIKLNFSNFEKRLYMTSSPWIYVIIPLLLPTVLQTPALLFLSPPFLEKLQVYGTHGRQVHRRQIYWYDLLIWCSTSFHLLTNRQRCKGTWVSSSHSFPAGEINLHCTCCVCIDAYITKVLCEPNSFGSLKCVASLYKTDVFPPLSFGSLQK